jgi:site-specific DNA-methyltransferase (adenine-specific)
MGEFRKQCEFVLIGAKGKFAPVHKRCLPGVFRHSIVSGAKRQHMTEKPVPLLRDLLEVVAPGGTVLDPFAGSATTAQACIETGRKFIGAELSADYFDTACNRLKELLPWTM